MATPLKSPAKIWKYIPGQESPQITNAQALTKPIEKINLGMKIQIREGSAAKNFEQLHSLLESHPESCMLCTDDCHPDDLSKGHINKISATCNQTRTQRIQCSTRSMYKCR